MTSQPPQKHSDEDNGLLSFPEKDGSGRLASVALGVTQDIILQKVNESLSRLNCAKITTTDSCYSDLKYVWQHLQKNDHHFKSRILTRLNNREFVQMVQKSWSVAGKTVSCDSDGVPWKCLKLAASLLWIASDEFPETCRHISDSEFLLTIVDHLKIMSNEKFLENPRKLFFVKAMLGLIHNVVRNYSECKHQIKNANGVEILKRLHSVTNSTNMMIKAKSLIVVSYLVDEQESEIIHASSDTITFILRVLRESLTSSDHFSAKYGMNAHEIVLGLNNIVLDDANKLTVVKCGAIPLYTQLLESSAVDEQTAAGSGVWCLAFVKENKLWIREEQRCIKALECLANKGNTPAGHAARGALWEIFREFELTNRDENEANALHVMISYQWEAQPIMVKIKDRLKNAGYKVWMDVERMSGSTLEAMALAVEKAAVILIGMTEKYKGSPSCRTESEYVFRLRKEIIPLRLQQKYSPDGWLGMLVGSRLYFDFSKEEFIEKQTPNLIKELGTRGLIKKPLDSIDGIPLKPLLVQATTSEKPSQVVTRWTKDAVRDWLASFGLKSLSDRLTDMDGTLLVEMVKLQRKAPEFFFNSMKTDFNLNFCDILKLSKELNKLQI